MPKLFESTTLNSMTLKNRFVRSATAMGLANQDGSCTQKLIDLMAKLAVGEVGLIISGFAFVAKSGHVDPFQMGIHSDDLFEGLSEMAEAVHKGGGVIAVQMMHAGLFADSELTGQEALGPSEMVTEGVNILWFQYEKATLPAHVTSSSDQRPLAIGFDSIALVQREH